MGTNFNYDDTSHQIIYDQINGGSGSEPLQLSSQAWAKLGNEIGETGKSYVQAVLSTILATRQGAAADAATAAISAMLPWIDDVTQIAHAAAQRTQDQADYWVTAKNSVPPVPPAPKSVGFFSDPGEWAAEKFDWFPGVTSDEEKAQQRLQDAAEQARQAMRVYQTSSNGNVDSAPAFTPPQTLDSSVGSLSLTSAGVGAAAPVPAMAGGAAPAHLLAAYHPTVPRPAVHQPATPPPVTNPPAATVSQLAPGAPTGQATSAAPQGRWPGTGTANEDVVSPPLAASAGVGGSATTRPAQARFAGSRRADGARSSEFGPRPSTAFGPRPTVTKTPLIEEMSGVRGSGASTGYGPPLAGAPSKRGERDREHRSKYLLHDDSHAIVGDLPPTAPPVIGADY
ncbi:MAG: PPE domain-containing protein [Pseudonocardiales bacterium]|nr:PPE domain-containing protein [Pseudonocardiales bacterium]MBV9652338.1 PPE domain-containing protein [Pseudonocardiales bacterium]